MTEKQITAREKELQSYFRMHPRLNLEFKAMMSRLLREHRIDVTPETLSRMIVALDRSGADVDPDGIKIPDPPADGEPHKAMEPSGMGEPNPIAPPMDEDEAMEPGGDLDERDSMEPGGDSIDDRIGMEPGGDAEPGVS